MAEPIRMLPGEPTEYGIRAKALECASRMGPDNVESFAQTLAYFEAYLRSGLPSEPAENSQPRVP